MTGYTYDVVRKTDTSGISLRVPKDLESLEVRDDFLYTTLYEHNAKKDNRSLVKIDTRDNTQTILSIEVSNFGLLTKGIVYQEYTSGKLMISDFDGNNARVLVDKNLDKIKIDGNKIYYTVLGEAGLYNFNVKTQDGEKLNDILVDDILINKSGVYFVNKSHEAGIFKISEGKEVKIANGFVHNYINTNEGVLYNKRGSSEVFLTN